MANTYTQINIHAIFAVNKRENILLPGFQARLFEYMAGILNNLNNYSLTVNGYRDHVHLFFELYPSKALADIVRIVKSSSSKWINENNFLPGKFSWQEGYGAFSYSRSQRDHVIKYILKQEQHHKKRSFKDEYLDLLNKFEIKFDNHYIFEFFDEQ